MQVSDPLYSHQEVYEEFSHKETFTVLLSVSVTLTVKLNGDSPHPPGFGDTKGISSCGAVERKNRLWLNRVPLL